jgi:predicted amidohydrolase YtcJ
MILIKINIFFWTCHRFPLFCSNALYIYPDMNITEQLQLLLPRYSNDPTSRLRFNQAKIYVDGILELTTAALYEPYLSSLELPTDEQYGFEYFGSNSTLQTIVTTLSDAGFQLHLHAVGDRAVGMALDAIEHVMTTSTIARTSGPHRLTHLYMIDDRDKYRFEQLDRCRCGFPTGS